MSTHSKETKGTKVNENKTRTVYRHTTVHFATPSVRCTVTKTSTHYDKGYSNEPKYTDTNCPADVYVARKLVPTKCTDQSSAEAQRDFLSFYPTYILFSHGSQQSLYTDILKTRTKKKKRIVAFIHSYVQLNAQQMAARLSSTKPQGHSLILPLFSNELR